MTTTLEKPPTKRRPRTTREWLWVGLVAFGVVVLATVLTLTTVQVLRVSGNGPVAAVKKPVAGSTATPAKPAYVQITASQVKRGDNLTFIAERNGLTLAQIVKLNPEIKNLNLIYPGQRIRIK